MPEKKNKYVLVIAEKPKAAIRIAFALADSGKIIKKNFFGVPYWEIECQGQNLIVASAVGHLFGLTEKEKSQTWPIFDLEWRAAVSFARKYISTLQHLAKDASDFILATDYDIEGELIGFNALRFICHQEDAKRMKFSTLTKPELLDSYKNIMPHIDFGQAYAGETRHFLDYYYGINLSRALMQAIKAAGAFKILSIGRVQGPALALVTEREKEIQKFVPEPYWQVFLFVKNRHSIEVKYPKNIFDEEKAKVFGKLKGRVGEARTEKEEKKLWPWPPFDLTTLQIEVYKFFGLSPAQTLAIAQRLYLAGLISYPRTSSQKLPSTIGYKRILDKLEKSYPNLSKALARDYPIQGKKTDPAHPAIFPTGEKPSEKISRVEKQVYDLIVKRFLSCFSAEALIEEKKIIVRIIDKEFDVSGKKILEPGWLAVYPAKIEEKELPDIQGKVEVKDVRLEEKETQPPRRYNPALLISELEKRNLGTKATRSTIIDTLHKRGYVMGRQIQATKLGMSVASALEKNCPLILDEQLTRKFEQEMQDIREEKNKEKMKEKEEDILKEARELLIKISKQFREHEKEIGQELAKSHLEEQVEQKKANTLCPCPVCKEGTLIMIRSRRGKRFAGCDRYPECKASYPLPQYGLIKLAGKKCSCGYPLLLLIRKGKPPWEFCFNLECPIKKEKAERKAKREEEKKAREKEKKKKAAARKRKATMRKKAAEKKKLEREKKKLEREKKKLEKAAKKTKKTETKKGKK